MILLLDTSTPVCKLTLVDGDWRYEDEWQADRTLAKNLPTKSNPDSKKRVILPKPRRKSQCH